MTNDRLEKYKKNLENIFGSEVIGDLIEYEGSCLKYKDNSRETIANFRPDLKKKLIESSKTFENLEEMFPNDQDNLSNLMQLKDRLNLCLPKWEGKLCFSDESPLKSSKKIMILKDPDPGFLENQKKLFIPKYKRDFWYYMIILFSKIAPTPLKKKDMNSDVIKIYDFFNNINDNLKKIRDLTYVTNLCKIRVNEKNLKRKDLIKWNSLTKKIAPYFLFNYTLNEISLINPELIIIYDDNTLDVLHDFIIKFEKIKKSHGTGILKINGKDYDFITIYQFKKTRSRIKLRKFIEDKNLLV